MTLGHSLLPDAKREKDGGFGREQRGEGNLSLKRRKASFLSPFLFFDLSDWKERMGWVGCTLGDRFLSRRGTTTTLCFPILGDVPSVPSSPSLPLSVFHFWILLYETRSISYYARRPASSKRGMRRVHAVARADPSLPVLSLLLVLPLDLRGVL